MIWWSNLGNPSSDIESYKVWIVNFSEVSSWLAILVMLLKSSTADTSSLGASEKLGSFWLDEGQRDFSLANTVFFRYDKINACAPTTYAWEASKQF